MMLAREFELITLWVTLNARRGRAEVTARLEATVDGEREVQFELEPVPVADASAIPAAPARAQARPGARPEAQA